jgi:hypothetical protein
MSAFKRLRGDVAVREAERALVSEIRSLDPHYVAQESRFSPDNPGAATPASELATSAEFDDLLIRARTDSIRIEQLAARELRNNFSTYLGPSQLASSLVDGYEQYAKTGNTRLDDFVTMRRAFTDTRGASNLAFSQVLASFSDVGAFDYSTTMFTKRKEWTPYVRRAALALRREGFFVLDERLPDSFVTNLRDSITAQMDASSGGKFSRSLAGTDRSTPQYKSSHESLTRLSGLYKLAADPVLRSIVAEYLGVEPIMNASVAFLNAPCDLTSHSDLSATAQMYHHDMERLGFVKLFVYLTDVDESSGPHAVIPGTHRRRPGMLWEDGRHSDAELEREGVLDSEVRIYGPAGTVFMVDTSMLHKGVHPQDNARMMFQIQYANSLFGRPIPSAERKVSATRTDASAETAQAANLVRKYALSSGVRLIQNLI